MDKDLCYLVECLKADLDDAITKSAWGGGEVYVKLYDDYLAQAGPLLKGQKLPKVESPHTIYHSGDYNDLDPKVRDGYERQVLLSLKPVVGQLLALLRS